MFAWALSLAIMLTIVFVNYIFLQIKTSKNTPLENGLYDALSRVGWSIALCYIIFACVHGYGGPINYFLSHPLFQPLNRLGYTMYIFHNLVIVYNLATMKASPILDEQIGFGAFISNYVMTLFVAFVTSLAFESPMLIVQKLIFDTKKKPASKTPTAKIVPTTQSAKH